MVYLLVGVFFVGFSCWKFRLKQIWKVSVLTPLSSHIRFKRKIKREKIIKLLGNTLQICSYVI